MSFYDKKRHNIIKCAENLQNWILESEMEGTLDKKDPFYPIYKNLEELKTKISDEI